MLRYRGALATNAKMKALGYPNLVTAREAKQRQRIERWWFSSQRIDNKSGRPDQPKTR